MCFIFYNLVKKSLLLSFLHFCCFVSFIYTKLLQLFLIYQQSLLYRGHGRFCCQLSCRFLKFRLWGKPFRRKFISDAGHELRRETLLKDFLEEKCDLFVVIVYPVVIICVLFALLESLYLSLSFVP